MRGGWSTTLALLPLLLLAGSSAASHAPRARAMRAGRGGVAAVRPVRGRGTLRAAAAAAERQFHATPVGVSVGGELDTVARFSALDVTSDSEAVIVELQIGR